MKEQRNEEFERTLDIHIMTVSATLVGVCLTAIASVTG